ncbi:MHF histone-fold complex component [Ophidiomyces ophidiicola]|uniref:MHF histone-fold complex component n=1 Tax=Ophidiomyces ophidiicola TaxID=1387563 RepID=UPI0020C2EA24|nr:MHF histone-fold complex component [Ophidiomyces ophidiicola]KAI1905925.1 MHF histone-fold complex component [Ophidiomyces ophidiicola]KAI1950600.1 MHF histone-fold complex component [Ophidiomyces ophidiicola]KAI1999701.1 MHF histone-fold complex component [Ophidiomyces ophidiicola]KAI2010418.1 MHF histone-fold complex component [Ophidiomyces ophidiicola]KAI2132089.1 MHF histone-fold complex component [Ophidiomyces ophidiicola]
MASTDGEDQHLEDLRLKAELWRTLRPIVRKQASEEDVDLTPSFLIAITEMVWDRIAETTEDLIMFAKYLYSIVPPTGCTKLIAVLFGD